MLRRVSLHSHAPVPDGMRSDRLLLRPLRVADAELDFDAVMSSAALLRRWSQSAWPADDFTLAGNRSDLERHEREHIEGTAFTFTVLDPAATRCLGCVYIVPLESAERAVCAATMHPARVAFWVRASELAHDLDRRLLATLLVWLDAAWSFDDVVFTIADGDTRQSGLLIEAGLARRAAVTLAGGRACSVFGRPRETSAQ